MPSHPLYRAGGATRPFVIVRDMSEYQITYWRDIPSMVMAREGDDTARAQLAQRFQEAIDEAAMRLGYARNVIDTGGAKTMKAEFVVPMDVAEKILIHVSHNYFEHYACIAWLADVQVVRGHQYANS